MTELKQPLLMMTPGPTRVPERVLRAGARPMMHHRMPEFRAELGEMVEMLGPVFGTKSKVLPVHTTGRGATEAAICNLFSPGDELIACCNGKFGEMWARFAASYGIVVHRIATDWAESVDPAHVEQALQAHPSARAVLVTYSDSSTGVRNDIVAVARVAHAHNAMVFVDAVSAIGGMPFEFDNWDIDVAITASQKCLMSSTGMSFVALSERAWEAAARSRIPRNYWDFAAIRKGVSEPVPETPGSTPIHLVLQVAEALRAIHEEGFENVLRRHAEMSVRTKEGVRALGLSMQCPRLQEYSLTLTAVTLPDGVAPSVVRKTLKTRGILTAAGMGQYESTSFRIGHMGDIRLEDVNRTLETLGEVLREHTPA